MPLCRINCLWRCSHAFSMKVSTIFRHMFTARLGVWTACSLSHIPFTLLSVFVELPRSIELATAYFCLYKQKFCLFLRVQAHSNYNFTITVKRVKWQSSLKHSEPIKWLKKILAQIKYSSWLPERPLPDQFYQWKFSIFYK